MSIMQNEDLVTYQLRAGYLTEIADGVGERLITLNDNIFNSAPFKAAGWRTNPALIKRTYSPPIPTAVASEYFRAPRPAGLTLEDEQDEGSVLAEAGSGVAGAGGAGAGRAAASAHGPEAALKRRRRREQMEEEDSSDLSDDTDDEADQRAAQQIKFSKMPVRHRAGSSPLQTTNKAPRPRTGSQSAVAAVKERARRDTVTSSDMSSENEVDVERRRNAARDATRKAARLRSDLSESEPTVGVKRQESDLLPEELEDDSEGSDASFASSAETPSILAPLEDPAKNKSPALPVVGTPPGGFRRQSTVRKSVNPVKKPIGGMLPPPRPMSMIRPMSIIQPRSLLSAALKAKKTKPALPFEEFATLSGQGEESPFSLRIYPYDDGEPMKPFELATKRRVRGTEGDERPINVSDLVGLALWHYHEQKIEPPLPADKLNVNWYTVRIVEDGGDIDDDFPPLERNKPLASFVSAPNNKNEGARAQAMPPRLGRGRSNTKTTDDFAIVLANDEEHAANDRQAPQYSEAGRRSTSSVEDDEITPRNTPQPNLGYLTSTSRLNSGLTTYRSDGLLADMPRPQLTASNTSRGHQKFLRIHLQLPETPPDQMVTLDVTTDMYMEEVLDLVCRKRNLDKAMHILRIPSSGAVALLDRPVAAIGAVSDLELHERRFGEASMGGSPGSSLTNRTPGGLGSGGGGGGGSESYFTAGGGKKASKKAQQQLVGTGSGTTHHGGGVHPLAGDGLVQEDLSRRSGESGGGGGGGGNIGSSSNYRRYVVYRKQAMRMMGYAERLFIIDGEYIHIVPSDKGKPVVDKDAKTATVHFSQVVGCKLSRRHPSVFKLVVFRASAESKTYEFEAKSQQEAAEAVFAVKSGTAPYQ